jgi:hypothetical protein
MYTPGGIAEAWRENKRKKGNMLYSVQFYSLSMSNKQVTFPLIKS